MNLLIIEDSPTYYYALCSTLPGSWKATNTITSKDALACLGREVFDVVLTDLNLPDSVGLQTAETVLNATSVPVVVMTGSSDTEIEQEAIRMGADAFFKNDLNEKSITHICLNAIARSGQKKEALRLLLETQKASRREGIKTALEKMNTAITQLSAMADGSHDDDASD